MNHPPLNHPFPALPSPGDGFVVDVSPSLSHSDSSLSFTVGHARSVRLRVRFILSASDIIAKPQGYFSQPRQARSCVARFRTDTCVITSNHSQEQRPRDSRVPTATVRKLARITVEPTANAEMDRNVSVRLVGASKTPAQELMIRRDGERQRKI